MSQQTPEGEWECGNVEIPPTSTPTKKITAGCGEKVKKDHARGVSIVWGEDDCTCATTKNTLHPRDRKREKGEKG